MKTFAVWVLLLAVVPGASHAEDQTQAVAEIGEYLDASNRGMEAAEQGSAVAQWLLAERYFRGLGQPQNYTEALKWYRKAAEQGYVAAQLRLGIMYDQGEGVPQNYAEAFKWYHKAAEHAAISRIDIKAAEQGFFAVQIRLGEMYYQGEGVPQNYAEAFKWYHKAAEHKVAEHAAISRIDIKAAEQVHSVAQFRLGIMYYMGRGVPQNYAEAFKWYHKAAEQGDSAAQHNLGIMYYQGQGVPKNDIMAYAWFSVAAASSKGEDSAKLRDGIAGEMTPEAIAKGQALAAEYWEKYVKSR